MRLILDQPHKAIWVAILIILSLSIINFGSVVDIQMHDTYLVVNRLHLGLLFSLILGVISLVYWAMRRRKLIPWMTFVHVVLTVLVFFFFISTLRDKTLIGLSFHPVEWMSKLIGVLLALAFLSQIVFLANIILSAFRPGKSA